MRSLRDLPNLEDFAPDEESRQFIRERLSGRAVSSTLEEAAADIDDERELLEGYGSNDAEVDGRDGREPIAGDDDELAGASAWQDDWEDGVDD